LQAPEFVRLNAARKIPVLVHGKKVLTESLAIAEYLCELRPDARLLPETPDENYEFRRLIHFTLSEVEAYLWHIFAWASGRAIVLPDSVARYGGRLARRSSMPDMLRPTQRPFRSGRLASP
jgi:glutathione S-transferase